MQIPSHIQKLIDQVIQPMDKDLQPVVASLNQLVNQDLFVKAYLRDVVDAVNVSESEDAIRPLLKTIGKRLSYFNNWESGEENQTRKMIEDGLISPDDIKPHIRLSQDEYNRFYDRQNEQIAQRVAGNKNFFNRFRSHTALKFRRNYDHCIRKTHAINVIESHMSLLDSMALSCNHKWLDIGCGNGLIANAVLPGRHTGNSWQVVGCDLQPSKISIANNNRCKGRS